MPTGNPEHQISDALDVPTRLRKWCEERGGEYERPLGLGEHRCKVDLGRGAGEDEGNVRIKFSEREDMVSIKHYDLAGEPHVITEAHVEDPVELETTGNYIRFEDRDGNKAVTSVEHVDRY